MLQSTPHPPSKKCDFVKISYCKCHFQRIILCHKIRGYTALYWYSCHLLPYIATNNDKLDCILVSSPVFLIFIIFFKLFLTKAYFFLNLSLYLKNVSSLFFIGLPSPARCTYWHFKISSSSSQTDINIVWLAIYHYLNGTKKNKTLLQ